MTDTDADAGWFAGRDADEAAGRDAVDAARDRIANGEADEPRDWPTLAVEAGFADSTDGYYDRLHEATVTATRATVADVRSDPGGFLAALRSDEDEGAIDAGEDATGDAAAAE